MESQLIYLHIEKTAGSSMRSLIFDNYGEADVFWYLVNSESPIFKESELQGQRVIGGHRDKSFYDQFEREKLYLSVVREPLDRVISLFNYHGNINPAREVWLDRGLDPNSIENTLKYCSEFIDEIENRQCQILSGKRDMESVTEALSEESFILSSMENLSEYVSYVGALLSWPTRKVGRVNRGGNTYQSNINVSRKCMDMIEELNKEDKRLYEFIKNKRIVDTVSENKKRSFVNRLKCDSKDHIYFEKNDANHVNLSLLDLTVTEDSIRAVINVENNSSSSIHASGRNPVWIGVKTVDDECRFYLEQDIAPNSSLEQRLVIAKTSINEGSKLFISLIRKNEYWFSEINKSHPINVALKK